MTDHVLAAWADDIRIRNEGLERGFPEHSQNGYQVTVHEIAQPGVVYRDSNVTVTVTEHSNAATAEQLKSGHAGSVASVV